jgi:hypothetical protein
MVRISIAISMLLLGTSSALKNIGVHQKTLAETISNVKILNNIDFAYIMVFIGIS